MSDKRPRIDRVTTTGGDQGKTSLADGLRYAKHDPRIELVGTLDELNCQLGVAAISLDGELASTVREIQARIFDLGAAVATGEPQPFWSRETDRLRATADELNETLEPLREFVLPGSNESNAQLNVARAIARRAERVFWLLNDPSFVEAGMGTYLNRLSDYLFIAARAVAKDEVLWQPRKE